MKYRKKPVEVDAFQFVDSVGVMNWVESFGGQSLFKVSASGIEITTLEGTMTAARGDWIIRGIAGEFYPCKPDIFDATYETLGEVLDEE